MRCGVGQRCHPARAAAARGRRGRGGRAANVHELLSCHCSADISGHANQGPLQCCRPARAKVVQPAILPAGLPEVQFAGDFRHAQRILPVSPANPLVPDHRRAKMTCRLGRNRTRTPRPRAPRSGSEHLAAPGFRLPITLLEWLRRIAHRGQPGGFPGVRRRWRSFHCGKRVPASAGSYRHRAALAGSHRACAG
jgi:hypothetical protein